MKTNAEIFKQVKDHLIKQGQRSVKHLRNGEIVCRYLDPDGNKCAVGCLIPYELYNPKIEGHSVDHPKVEEVLKLAGIGKESLDMLSELQAVHDYLSTWENGNLIPRLNSVEEKWCKV